MDALRKAQVKIYDPEDGSIEVLCKGKALAFRAYNFQEKQGEVMDTKTLKKAVENNRKIETFL
jgi:hypothetical protein